MDQELSPEGVLQHEIDSLYSHGRIDPVVSKSLNEDLVIYSIEASVIAHSADFVECNKLAGILEVMKGPRILDRNGRMETGL